MKQPSNTAQIFSFVLVLVLLIILDACKQDPIPAPYMGYEYFPTAQGHELIFEVDSSVRDGFTGDSIFYKYYIKEVIDGTYEDNAGVKNELIKRYWRKSPSENWEYKEDWYQLRNENRAETVIENRRVVRLIFPIREGAEWLGNLYYHDSILTCLASETAWSFEYTDLIGSYDLDGTIMDSIVTVEQSNLQEQVIGCSILSVEKFAPSIGMVYRRNKLVPQDSTLNGYDCLYQLIGHSN